MKGQLMPLNRRLLLGSISAGIATEALALPVRPVLGQSRESTPEADPSGERSAPGTLEDALLGIEPDWLLSRLMTADVTTPLFPSDTGTVEAHEWTDNDSDLFGSVGGVLMQTSTDENNNFIGPGVYIILRDEDDAAERLETAGTPESDGSVKVVSVAGFSGLTIIGPTDEAEPLMASYAVTLLQVGYLLVSAVANGPADASTEFRSVANAIGLLDHLRSIMP